MSMLEGIRVLDLSRVIAGPYCATLLGDLGADVIKVERPGEGDQSRGMPAGTSANFHFLNRNKRSIAIDLKRLEGQAIVHRLVRDADVVLENFGPGTIERLKCSWEDLRQINPRLVYLSMKGFLKGPYENRGALDEVVQMQSGLAYMTGPPGRPLRAGAPVIDILGGVFGVVAALAALRERDGKIPHQRLHRSFGRSHRDPWKQSAGATSRPIGDGDDSSTFTHHLPRFSRTDDKSFNLRIEGGVHLFQGDIRRRIEEMDSFRSGVTDKDI